METKKQFRERLESEGHWDEFVRYREKLKAGGLSAKDAWAKARQDFRPGMVSGATGEDADYITADRGGIDSIVLDVFEGKPTASARQIVQWVFDHIDVEDIQPEDAPSPGAWSFLQRVRQHPELLKEFYRSIWAKMLPTRSEIEAREKFEDDGREQLHLIDQIRQARDRANG